MCAWVSWSTVVLCSAASQLQKSSVTGDGLFGSQES
jgi:hypothetical protein